MPRKKSRNSQLVDLERDIAIDHRAALPLAERHLSFGDRWS